MAFLCVLLIHLQLRVVFIGLFFHSALINIDVLYRPQRAAT